MCALEHCLVDYARHRTSRLLSIYYSCFRHPGFRRRTHVLYLLYPPKQCQAPFSDKIIPQKYITPALGTPDFVGERMFCIFCIPQNNAKPLFLIKLSPKNILLLL
jgi:hypothetical protein